MLSVEDWGKFMKQAHQELIPHVFISYSHNDRAFVQKLAQDLRDNGGNKVWLDLWEIRIGDSIIGKIEEGINESDFLIVVLSEHSVMSNWVISELRSALTIQLNQQNVKVLPVLIDDCQKPLFLNHIRHADFRPGSNYNEAFAELLNAIDPSLLPVVDNSSDDESFPVSDSEKTIDLNRLAELLHTHFDLEELKSLCFNLNERYDDLRGETLRVKTEELVAKLQRQDRLSELVKRVKVIRPKAPWDDVYFQKQKGSIIANMFGVEEEPYSKDLFVNRKENLNRISSKIKVIQSNGIAESPIFNIWGVRGIGKSWFTAHLRQLYQYDGSPLDKLSPAPTFTLFHRFPKEKIDRIDNEEFARVFLEQVQEQLQKNFLPDEQSILEQAYKNKQIESLVDLLKAVSKRFVPVILFDQTESVFNDWANLEKLFVEPLVTTNRIIFIIAGRRPIPEWVRFETRRRVAPLEISRLNGFTRDDIQEQIHRLSDQSIDVNEIYKWSVTSPLIAKALLVKSKQQLGEEQFTATIWQQHQSEILTPVYQLAIQYLFEGVPESLVEVLKAVAVLRYYRLEGVRYMLKLQGGEERPFNYYLKLIRALEQDTEYVWWNRERRAYTTSRIVRSLLLQNLQLSDPDLFVQKHQQAAKMYKGWVNEYPEASEDFILEIWFHRASIYTVTEDVKTLEQELKNEIEFALENLSYDRANTLSMQFETDTELQELLPEPLFLTLNNLLKDALEEGKEPLISNGL